MTNQIFLFIDIYWLEIYSIRKFKLDRPITNKHSGNNNVDMHINNVVVIVYILNSCYTYCFLMLPNTFFKYPLKSNTVAIILIENLQQLYEYFNKLMAAKYNYFCRLENVRIFFFDLDILRRYNLLI